MPPPILLSLTIAMLYGCAWHALFGRRIWQWPLFLVAAFAGFFGGYAAGVIFGIEWLQVGSVPLAAATAGALLTLWLSWFFSAPAATGQGG